MIIVFQWVIISLGSRSIFSNIEILIWDKICALKNLINCSLKVTFRYFVIRECQKETISGEI